VQGYLLELLEKVVAEGLPQNRNFVKGRQLSGWQVVPRAPAMTAENWPVLARSPLCPCCAVSVAEQERDVPPARSLSREQSGVA
jgi:hypothetical protein